jgi:hypothetical protein
MTYFRQCTNRALATLYVKDEETELAKVNTMIRFFFCYLYITTFVGSSAPLSYVSTVTQRRSAITGH